MLKYVSRTSLPNIEISYSIPKFRKNRVNPISNKKKLNQRHR